MFEQVGQVLFMCKFPQLSLLAPLVTSEQLCGELTTANTGDGPLPLAPSPAIARLGSVQIQAAWLLRNLGSSLKIVDANAVFLARSSSRRFSTTPWVGASTQSRRRRTVKIGG
jgi:hypothetical protein